MGLKQVQEQRTQSVAELDLRPEVKQHLLGLLDTYAILEVDYAACKHQMDLEQSKIGKLLADYGINKAGTDSLSLCWVRGSTTSKLSPEKLLAQGVTLAQIEAATITKPKKDYFQIRGKKSSAEPSEE